MSIDAINNELNKLYITDRDKYKDECDLWKSKGYKIYRDNKGRHKVVKPPKKVDQKADIVDVFNEMFGWNINKGEN